MQRNITLKKIDSQDVIQKIDDSKTAFIKVYYKTATLIKLLQASQSDKKVSVNADMILAFNKTSDNMHRLQKQMRAKQRSQNIRLSSDKTLTHYVYSFRKVKIETRSVNETTKANCLKVHHLYEAKIELSEEDFETLKKFIAELK
jgi:hypothetical protein